MFHSLRHKILLVVAVCASITLLGFFAVYWLTLEQHQSLERHHDLPAVSLTWFTLNNGVHRAAWAQKAWLDSGDQEFLKERDLAWGNDIHPAFKQLDLLYKKVRVWEGERSVERRVFYDLRLMVLALENLQQKTSEPSQSMTVEEAQIIWTEKEWPLVQNISRQVEIVIRWQTDFARQQDSELRRGLSGLGIWIWIVASVVLLLVLVLAVFFANRITAPLRKLRGAVQQVTKDQFRDPIKKSIEVQDKAEEFTENEDEVQTLTEVFHKMESVIRERTELLEASNRQLDEASRAKGMYLISMSHELRTPLNAIIGFAEVLLESGKEGPLSVYQIDRLGRILKSGQHLLELINSLLDLSKIEAGQMEVSKSDFQLKILLQDVMEWLEPLMQKKSLEYELVFHPDTSIMLYSDSGKVRQVLINLLGNAIKFTDSGGRIKVSSSQDKTGISIAVQDTGCGISAEQQQSIFDVFHQVNSSEIRVDSSDLTLHKGTGLGLALVQSLMKLLGGSVSLESVYGKGSTFTIHFQGSCSPKLET